MNNIKPLSNQAPRKPKLRSLAKAVLKKSYLALPVALSWADHIADSNNASPYFRVVRRIPPPTVTYNNLAERGFQVSHIVAWAKHKHSDIAYRNLYRSMTASGLWVGHQIATTLAIAKGLSPIKSSLAFLLTGASGILGAKMLGAAQFSDSIQAVTQTLISNGGTWYGGAIGGTLGLVAFAKAAKLPVAKILDSLTPGGLVGLGIGRLGCWTASCCVGELFGAHQEPIATAVNISLGLFLTQLQEKFAGRTFILGTGMYAIFRFLIEYARREPSVLAGLTLAQTTSLLLLGGGAWAYTKLAKNPISPTTETKSVESKTEPTAWQNFKRALFELFAFSSLGLVDFSKENGRYSPGPAPRMIAIINFVRVLGTGLKALVQHFSKK